MYRPDPEPHPVSPVAPHPSTAAAREILRHYLAEWGERAVRGRGAGLSRGGEEEPGLRLLYVDGFSYSGGRRLLTGGGWGGAGAESPLLGARALASLAARGAGSRLPVHASAVLVEEDPVHVDHLLRDLEGTGLRARAAERLDSPAPGEAVVLHAPLADAAAEVARALAEADHALCFLDPPAPGKLPLSAARTLAPDADLLLAFPHADLRKLTRYRVSPLADLPPQPRRVADGYAALLGDPRFAWLPAWREAERAEGEAGAELRVAARYAAALAEAGRAVKPLTLRFANLAADSLHLLLLTDDPERALSLNGVVRRAGLDEEVLREESLRMRAPLEASGPAEALDLFAGEEPRAAEPPPGVREADLGRLVRVLVERFRGRTVPYREILLGLVETDLDPAEVRRALAALKRSGEALYRSLADPGQPVAFPSVPVPPERRRRQEAPDLLTPLDPPAE
jgi:hypothetical protein